MPCLFLQQVENGRVLKERFSPVELAGVTAEQAFHMADDNQDGLLSFDEFKNWYASEAGQAINSRNKPEEVATNNSQEKKVFESTDPSMSLTKARSLTGLGDLKVQDIFDSCKFC